MKRFLGWREVIARMRRGDLPERMENYAVFADGMKVRPAIMHQLEREDLINPAKPNIGARWTMKQSGRAIPRLLAVLALIAYALSFAAQNIAPAECHTDTECAALCPADDADCDGGPQQ